MLIAIVIMTAVVSISAFVMSLYALLSVKWQVSKLITISTRVAGVVRAAEEHFQVSVKRKRIRVGCTTCGALSGQPCFLERHVRTRKS